MHISNDSHKVSIQFKAESEIVIQYLKFVYICAPLHHCLCRY